MERTRRELLQITAAFGAGLAIRSIASFGGDKRPPFNEFPFLPGEQKIARLLNFIDNSDVRLLQEKGQDLRIFIEDGTFKYGVISNLIYGRNPFQVEFIGGYPDLYHSRWLISLADATRINSPQELSVFFFQAMDIRAKGSKIPNSELGDFAKSRLNYEAESWAYTMEFVYKPLKDKINSKVLAYLWNRYQKAQSGTNFDSDWRQALIHMPR